MAVKTCLWVQGSVLAEAIEGKATTNTRTKNGTITGSKRTIELDFDRSGGIWGWTKCFLSDGDITVWETPGSFIGVVVADPNSEYHNQSATLSHELLRRQAKDLYLGSPPLLMANEWESVVDDAAVTPPDDLITLTHLHEASVVFCLKRRYQEDLIYSATGPMLIALNPFKSLPGLYDDSVMNDHWLEGEGLADLKLRPHIFKSAHIAFRSMMHGVETKKTEDANTNVVVDQSILVSGESGAGKTVTTKYVMKYLATLSRRKAEHAKRRRAASPGRSNDSRLQKQMSKRGSRALSWKVGAYVEERILESNPILEAFGNARTVRNDNSSRFGKFIELQFKQTGSLIGANINTYLLEKVRLVHQAEEERNFHIFYELLAASTESERRMFMLDEYTAQDFKMTNQSGTYGRRDGIDDAKQYDSLIYSLGTMGFDQWVQQDIIAVCCAFLHASNLTFLAPTEDSSKVDDSNPHLEPVLELLGLDKTAFNAAMTEFQKGVGKQSFTRHFTVEGAENTLLAFIKGTYGAMFSFIVQIVNKQIDHSPKAGAPNNLGKAGTISVLDIFGFESFGFNSFEQLCINYCNEALQQQFNRFIFKTEQEEYKREGIEWDFIKFPDNMDVIDLIDKGRVGILSILTDQCRTPHGTDKSFIDAVYNQWRQHQRFLGTALHQGKMQFIIDHYAGPVMYSSADFVEKNKDETPRGASALLESSSKNFVRWLGKMAIGSDEAPPAGSRPKKRPTVGSQFSSQLADLRARIDQTSPHYVRCLKPNQSLKAAEFDSAMIADQLRYAGVLEAIRVSRVGYSQRYTKGHFVDRYRFIAPRAVHGVEDKVSALEKAIFLKIWASQNPNNPPPPDLRSFSGIQQGTSKVFLRQNAFEAMERIRTETLRSATVKIQSVSRRFLGRCIYYRTKRHIIVCQAMARRFHARNYLRAYREGKAATSIQANWRMSALRRQFISKKYASLWLQRTYRGHTIRQRYKKLLRQKKDETAADDLRYRSAVVIQCMYRVKVARSILDNLFFQERRPSKAPLRIEVGTRKSLAQADRAAGVANQFPQVPTSDLDLLDSRLAGSKKAAVKAKFALEELLSVQELWVGVMAAETERKSSTIAKRQEKREGPSEMYRGHPDLMALNERLHHAASQTKKSKEELRSLIQALDILN